MNLDNIIKCIEDNLSVNAEILKEAEELHKKFPYTSIFPAIILKGLKESKSVHFDHELKNLAIQVNDRAILERYIESPSTHFNSAPSDAKDSPTAEQQSPLRDLGEKVETVESKIEELEDAAVKVKNEIEKEEVEKAKDKSHSAHFDSAPSDSKGSPMAEQQPPLGDLMKEEVEAPVVEKENIKVEKEEQLISEKPIKTAEIPVQSEEKIAKTNQEEDDSSDGLSPETLALIAEIKRKYGEEETGTARDTSKSEEIETVENKGEEEVTFDSELSADKDSLITENHEPPLKDHIEEKVETDESKDEESSVELDKEEVDEEEIINFSLEDSIGSSKKEKKKLEKKRKKKSKKDKKKLAQTLDKQKHDSPFKFKEFKGEDEEYYHLEIDFSDLEPIEYSDKEFEETVELENFIEEPLKHKSKKKSVKKKDAQSEIIKKIEPVEEIEEEQSSTFEEPVKIDITSSSEMTFLDWLKANKTENQKKTTAKQSSKKQGEIIDKFIEEEPSISKGKKEFFSPTKNAKKSLQDDMEIVSETLAELHVYQGSYSKAKKLYKKLILKNPEKKSLFAKKLEEISELEKKNKF